LLALSPHPAATSVKWATAAVVVRRRADVIATAPRRRSRQQIVYATAADGDPARAWSVGAPSAK